MARFRRRFYRRRRGGRRGYRSGVTRKQKWSVTIGTGFPSKLFAKQDLTVWSQFPDSTAVTGIYAAPPTITNFIGRPFVLFDIKLNDMFNPCSFAAGSAQSDLWAVDSQVQPYLCNQLVRLYARYRVHGCLLEVYARMAGNLQDALSLPSVGFDLITFRTQRNWSSTVSRDQMGTSADPELDHPESLWKLNKVSHANMLTPASSPGGGLIANGPHCVFKKYYSIRKILGMSRDEFSGNENVAGTLSLTTGAAPVTQVAVHVQVFGAPQQAVRCQLICFRRFYVEWYDTNRPDASTDT